MWRALIAEVTKLRRASLPLWTLVTIVVGPALSNVFATSQQAESGRLSWIEFFGLGPMAMGTWYGILLFGLITAFLFGREYAEGVAPTVLTVPMRREHLVFAKLIVLAVWIVALAVVAVAVQAAWATLLGLDGFAWAPFWTSVGEMFTVALLIFLTLPLVALLAVAGKGVFAPMIFSAFGFSAGMIGGIAGWGGWLPWAMPTAVAGTFLGPVVDLHDVQLTAGSWVIAIGVFAAGLLATLAWVNRADSK